MQERSPDDRLSPARADRMIFCAEWEDAADDDLNVCAAATFVQQQDQLERIPGYNRGVPTLRL